MAGLETTATLDFETDEFVIHTPNKKATKAWPGTLGQHATHALVFARCIVGENDYGVQPFMVQIRSTKDHSQLDGVQCGDMGNKIGYQSMDNGWLRFAHKRIPRVDMLGRFVNIEKDGTFELKGDPRLIYQIMVQTRMMIIFGAGFTLMRSLIVAVRYAACRRQFATIKGSRQERQLIDYQAHMAILGT